MGPNRYPVHTVLLRDTIIPSGERLPDRICKGQAPNTHLRARPAYSLQRGRRLGMVFLQIGEDGVARRNTLPPAPKALSKSKNLIICETIATNYDYYPPRWSYERANQASNGLRSVSAVIKVARA